MHNKEVTEKQLKVLNALAYGPLSTTHLWTKMGRFTKDQLHSSLRRLEDREFVRRASEHPIEWELTRKGRLAVR